MNITETLVKMRDDMKTWTTNNLNALDQKIESKTIPIDNEMSSTSTNPVQNKVIQEKIEELSTSIGTVSNTASNTASQVQTMAGKIQTIQDKVQNIEDTSDDTSLVITDSQGAIAMKVDNNGVTTTAVTVRNGEDEDKGTIIEEDDLNCLTIVDGNGNKALTLDDNGLTVAAVNTKELLVDGKTINEMETDPTVPAWAKEVTKPSYELYEIGSGAIDEAENGFIIVDKDGKKALELNENGLETTDIKAKTLALETPLSITSGGTGGNTAATARTNLEVYSKSETDAKVKVVKDILDEVKSDVDIFFTDADMTAQAKDTLKEIQTYMTEDAAAATQMVARIGALETKTQNQSAEEGITIFIGEVDAGTVVANTIAVEGTGINLADLGESDATAGTSTAFARIKKLEANSVDKTAQEGIDNAQNGRLTVLEEKTKYQSTSDAGTAFSSDVTVNTLIAEDIDLHLVEWIFVDSSGDDIGTKINGNGIATNGLTVGTETAPGDVEITGTLTTKDIDIGKDTWEFADSQGKIIAAIDADGITTTTVTADNFVGTAADANKLNTNAGSATQPIYFSNGIPVATTYSLNKSVPANAIFTDTDTGATSVEVTGGGNAVTAASYDANSRKITLTKGATYNNYTLPVATSSTLGGVKSGADITVDATGNVSINDDSHDHIISNIDGLQTALDALEAKTQNQSATEDGIVFDTDVTVNTLITDNISVGQDAWNFVDSEGNVGTRIDGDGIETTTVTADSFVVNGKHLTTVATSGDYNDLTNKPTIPVDTNTIYQVIVTNADDNSEIATASSETYLNLIDVTNTPKEVISPILFIGSGSTTVSSTGHNDIRISSTDTTYSNADGEDAGLVKSGGDVTITDGIITVNDDSHNHVISNIDGLQTALNEKPGYFRNTENGAETFNNSACSATGANSHAEGYNTLASGDGSHAEGYEGIASKDSCHVEGYNCRAYGNQAHAEGYETRAGGIAAHSEGHLTQAGGNHSHAEGKGSATEIEIENSQGVSTIYIGEQAHAEGLNTVAIGVAAHAEGQNTRTYLINDDELWTVSYNHSAHAEGYSTIASGIAAHAEGYETIASGEQAHAEGWQTEASGTASHAGGFQTIASGAYQTVVGIWNAEKDGFNVESANSITNGIFIVGVGNGESDEQFRSNGFRVSQSGNCYGAKTYSTGGADYAEYFEWYDGNSKSEDRRGLFVTLDKDKIRPATFLDDYILGIISSTPSVVGDTQSEEWQNKYLKDIFGEYLYETVKIPEKVSKNGTIVPAHMEKRKILNPNYDPNVSYTTRELRKEWSPVGLVGKLVVVDNGTCEPNGYCYPGVDGIATYSKEKTPYRVMERLDDTHIRVFIK